ncbi:hypothetical protein [Gordonia caeni]|uniref:LGFP repeat-containing protein n=1 Tax=Gordonia caeni TaxID=1007097 RepID=A0ABP7PIV1_9ACTN
MRKTAHRRTAGAVAGLAAVALIAAGCSSDTNDDASPSNAAQTGVSATQEPEASASTAESESSAAPASASEASADASEVKVMGERDVEVTMTGPIAVKYASATDAQKKTLGKPLTGDHNAETRDSGVVFQQFQGGVITAKNDDPGTPAYITWGKIRDAWNTERAADGTPSQTGKNGSEGPLGVATSDEVTDGDLKESTFEHGKVTYNTKTGKVTVTVNGKVVPAE